MPKNRTVAIGICGASGSGKTTFSTQLKKTFPNNATILSQDSYYRDFKNKSQDNNHTINFDHPNSIEFALLTKHIKLLKAGTTINQPNYCFSSHSRTSHTTPIETNDILIIEGTLIFTDKKLRDEFNINIFLDIDLDICLSRRIKRDVKQRGRSLDSILYQYEATVRPMAKLFMPRQKTHADIIIDSDASLDNAINKIKKITHQYAPQYNLKKY